MKAVQVPVQYSRQNLVAAANHQLFSGQTSGTRVSSSQKYKNTDSFSSSGGLKNSPSDWRQLPKPQSSIQIGN